MSWVYKRTEANLWTVGYHAPDGTWNTDSDHPSSDAAARRTAWLNGDEPAEAEGWPSTSTPPELLQAAAHGLELCRRIIERCQLESGSRHQFADGSGRLAGCSLGLDELALAVEAIALTTGGAPWDPAGYSAAIAGLYRRYKTSKDLARACQVRCEGGA